MPMSPPVQPSLGRRRRVVHASIQGRPVCKTRPGPSIRLTTQRVDVTCRHCREKIQAVHYAPAGAAHCSARGTRLCTTSEAALTTCTNCLRMLGHLVIRRTGQNHAHCFPVVQRHYGVLTAPCGTAEPGFARTLEWGLVDCAGCLAHREHARAQSHQEQQAVLLGGSLVCTWE